MCSPHNPVHTYTHTHTDTQTHGLTHRHTWTHTHNQNTHLNTSLHPPHFHPLTQYTHGYTQLAHTCPSTPIPHMLIHTITHPIHTWTHTPTWHAGTYTYKMDTLIHTHSHQQLSNIASHAEMHTHIITQRCTCPHTPYPTAHTPHSLTPHSPGARTLPPAQQQTHTSKQLTDIPPDL